MCVKRKLMIFLRSFKYFVVVYFVVFVVFILKWLFKFLEEYMVNRWVGDFEYLEVLEKVFKDLGKIGVEKVGVDLLII